jgi:type I restriction enzyme S subunit
VIAVSHPIKAIKDLCSFSSGHGFTRHDWAKTGMPIIRIAHLNGSRNFDYYRGEAEPEWVVEPGELLFAWAGTKGVSFGPTIWNGPRGVLNQHIFRVRPREGVDQTWLYYALLQVTQRIEKRAHGFKSTLLHVRKADIEDQRWPVPPPEDQRQIVRLLGLAEGEVRSLDDLIQVKNIFKHGLMQQLLTGRKRFPKFKDRPWVEQPLATFFVEKTVTNADRGVELVYSCTKTAGIVPQAERFGKRLASADLVRYKVVEPGDLVYDPMLLWDGSIGFVPANARGVVSPAYETFSVNDAANREYFSVLLKSYNLIHRYRQISQGTNTRRRKAHPRDFLKTVVPIPPTKEEQDRIAAVLTAVQREIDLLKALRKQIEAKKHALLFRLLSGELPVTESV